MIFRKKYNSNLFQFPLETQTIFLFPKKKTHKLFFYDFINFIQLKFIKKSQVDHFKNIKYYIAGKKFII